MATDNPKATVYLDPTNYEALVKYSDSKGITLKHKEGKAVISSSLLNQVLSELFVGNDSKCDTGMSLNGTLAEILDRVSALEEFRERIEGLESDRPSLAGKDQFDSPDGATYSYEALFIEIEQNLTSELKLGKQSATAKKIHKVMERFRQQYP